MGGVVQQWVAIEIRCKEVLAVGNRLCGTHLSEACLLPDLFGRLDNEGAGLAVESIGVRLKPAPFGLLKGEGEGIKTLVGSQPDKLAAPWLDQWLEVSGVFV